MRRRGNRGASRTLACVLRSAAAPVCTPMQAGSGGPPSPGAAGALGAAATAAPPSVLDGQAHDGLASCTGWEMVLYEEDQPVVAAELAAPTGVSTDPLAMFVDSVTVQLQDAVLGTPPGAARVESLVEGAGVLSRRSGRIAARPRGGATMEEVARASVARRLGSLPQEASFSAQMVQAYMELFDGPLSDMAVEAIDALVLAVKKRKATLPVLAAGTGAGRPVPLIVA